MTHHWHYPVAAAAFCASSVGSGTRSLLAFRSVPAPWPAPHVPALIGTSAPRTVSPGRIAAGHWTLCGPSFDGSAATHSLPSPGRGPILARNRAPQRRALLRTGWLQGPTRNFVNSIVVLTKRNFRCWWPLTPDGDAKVYANFTQIGSYGRNSLPLFH